MNDVLMVRLQARQRGDGALAARLKATSMAVQLVDDVRKVCLAFESVEVGQHMLAWATKYCLFPDDEVYIVHCLSKVPSSSLNSVPDGVPASGLVPASTLTLRVCTTGRPLTADIIQVCMTMWSACVA